MFRCLALVFLLLVSPMYAAVPATPIGLTSTGYVNGSIPLAWTYLTYPVIPAQWYVYVNGVLSGAPTRTQVGVNAGVVTWTLTGVPAASIPASIYLKALSTDGVSGAGVPITVTGTGGSGTAQAVSVTASVLPEGASTEATLVRLTPAGSSTTGNVSGSTSSQTILPANASRKGFIVYNDSSATLYIKYGATASATSFTEKLYSNSSYSETRYTGRVDGVWSTATGAARITELF